MVTRLVCLAALLLAANASIIDGGLNKFTGGEPRPGRSPYDGLGSPNDNDDKLQPQEDIIRVPCRPPGNNKCAVIAWSSSSHSARGVNVTSGNCDNIVAKNVVNENGTAYSGNWETTYGPVLSFGASVLQRGHISGLSGDYDTKEYNESCFFDPSDPKEDNKVVAAQCNFDC